MDYLSLAATGTAEVLETVAIGYALQIPTPPTRRHQTMR
jgi:hypothetical protein